jgi:hypothetical protein
MFTLFTMGQADQIIKLLQASVTCDFNCKRTELCLFWETENIFLEKHE